MVSPNVAWQKYINSSNQSINKYLSKYGNAILEQTFQRLKLAIKSKKSHIILFRFKDSDIVSKIDRNDYVPALEQLLNLCTKLEKYEMCREIHNEIKIQKLKEARGIKPKAKVT
jgi:galactokinase/mevalonate kinase-like predicted kinase